MKTMKKAMAMVLALVMCFTLSVSVFATEPSTAQTHKVTINNAGGDTSKTHTYEAYQIFSGTYDVTTKKLSDVDWGANIETSGTFTFGEKDYDLTKADDAAALADALAKNSYDDETMQAFAAAIAGKLTGDAAGTASSNSSGKAEITGLKDGYYFIKDKDDSLDETENAAYTRYILQVLGDETVTAKADVPTVEKKVQDINDSTETAAGSLQDSADYDIGDEVPFTLTGTLPENYASYKAYKYVFHDTLSTGLTYKENAKVYAVNGETGTETEITESATVTSEGNNLTITLADLKQIAKVTITKDTKIVVRYTAELNANAVTGTVGNKNEVYLEFSNDPNESGEGDPSTGETPKDTVIVFTYKVIANKVDENNKPLEGAEFTLYKWVKNGEADDAGEWEQVGEPMQPDQNQTFTFKGIDDGRYKLVESKTPAGYNTIKDQIFTVSATHDDEQAAPTMKDLAGNVIDGVIEFTANDNDGSLSTTVVNKAGATLPSTGGIGTTIFYIIGGILVVGAAILLVTKKRMSKEV